MLPPAQPGHTTADRDGLICSRYFLISHTDTIPNTIQINLEM